MQINFFRFEITPSIRNNNTRVIRYEIQRQAGETLHLQQEVPIDDMESFLHFCFKRAEASLKREILRLKGLERHEPIRPRHTENDGLPQGNNRIT